MRRPRGLALRLNSLAHLGQRPGDADLLGHAQVGAPPDGDAFGRQVLEGAVAVQHHGDGVGALGPAVVAQLPPDLVASSFDNQAVAQAVPSLLAEQCGTGVSRMLFR